MKNIFKSIVLASVLIASPLAVLAQNESTTPRNSSLTQESAARNSTGSCDSTCDAMGVGNAPAIAGVAAFMTRVQACGAGYSGSKTQTRNQNPDGSYTAWVDADRSLCVCQSTYQDATQTCAAPLGGTYVQRTPWVCNSNVGSWGTPSTVTNNCFTPCALPSPSSQSQTLGCSAGYNGTYSQSRSAYCPGGIGSNSSPTWGGWSTYSNSCTPAAPSIMGYMVASCVHQNFKLPRSYMSPFLQKASYKSSNFDEPQFLKMGEGGGCSASYYTYYACVPGQPDSGQRWGFYVYSDRTYTFGRDLVACPAGYGAVVSTDFALPPGSGT